MATKTTKVEASTVRKPPNAGKGRPKGSKNKTTSLLKDALLMAATEAGGPEGLVGYLRQQAFESPSAFLSLLGKVLPLQVTGEDGESVKVDATVLVTGVRRASD